MPLDKAGSRCADAHDKVGRFLSIEDMEVLDEWDLRVFVRRSGAYKRVVLYV
jgi:hypothetical protein